MNDMKTFMILDSKKDPLPKKFLKDDNRFPSKLVEFFLEEYTQKGDNVIDVFAGLGTTLIVSEQMGRVPFGIESNKERFNFIKSKIGNKKNIIHGNSLQISRFKFPQCDFCISSPIYMPKNDKYNPLTNSKSSNYGEYLKGILKIYSNLKKVMKQSSYVVIEVSNLKGKDVTTLAFDIAKEVSKVFHFEGEIVVGWVGNKTKDGTYGFGYDHSYCLVFRNL